MDTTRNVWHASVKSRQINHKPILYRSHKRSRDRPYDPIDLFIARHR
jgi:hypothetical protein